MHPVLGERNLFLVKEHVGLFKAASNYDVYDPATGEIVIECREEKLGPFTRFLRFTDYKRMTPFDTELRTPSGEPILRVNRGWCLLRSQVQVSDENGSAVGGFRQKLFSIGGAFDVQDVNGLTVCALKGKWTGWDFRFVAGDMELARVSKKWSGLGKELFTSADTYMLEIDEAVEPENPVRLLILGAVMCIDLVLKE